MITTLFFDLGDTLWHFPNMPPLDRIRQETVRRLRETLERWGYDMDGERFYLGRDIRLAVEEETSRAFHGDCIDPGYPELCRRIARMHGMDLTSEQSKELWEAWNLGGAFLGRELFPDVLPALRKLRDRGFRLGSITNRAYSGPRFHQELRDLGLARLFEVTVVSCDIGYMKPHPGIFQVALERMGIDPEEAVMVGDNLRADVEGAKTLGMRAVWKRPVLATSSRTQTASSSDERPQPLEPTEPGEPEIELTGPLTPDWVIDNIAELEGIAWE
jgi:HAD superfamily hydrolase (TIGR01662 family)